MTPRLSTLPEELDIRILRELDAQNILTCALVGLAPESLLSLPSFARPRCAKSLTA